jgi:hypothetical protein
MFAGGYFSEIGGAKATNIAAWDGLRWSALGDGIGVYDPSLHLATEVNSIVIVGSRVFVGGRFTNAGSVYAQNIANWDGTRWSGLGDGLDNIVFELATSDGVLYAGGQFGVAGTAAANRIAKWDGVGWSALGEGVANPVGSAFVHAIATSGPDVYVGGRFTRAGDVAATNIAKWDGAEWTALGAGLGPDPVYALAVGNSQTFAGGAFSQSAAVSVRNVALWDGANWIGVGGGVTGSRGAYPYVLSLLGNGKDIFLAGGDILQVGGIDATNIAKWDGARWSALGGGVSRGLNDSSAHSMASTGSEIIVGGFFDTAGANRSTNVALWHIPHSLTATRSGDEVILRWPATGTNFVLEAKGGVASADWSEVAQPFTLTNDECVVTDPLSASNQFYRLRRR